MNDRASDSSGSRETQTRGSFFVSLEVGIYLGLVVLLDCLLLAGLAFNGALAPYLSVGSGDLWRRRCSRVSEG